MQWIGHLSQQVFNNNQCFNIACFFKKKQIFEIGRLLTGDCANAVHLWERQGNQHYDIVVVLLMFNLLRYKGESGKWAGDKTPYTVNHTIYILT